MTTEQATPLYRPQRQPEEVDPEFGPRQSRPPRPCYRLPLNKAVRIDRDRPAPARCDAKGRALPFHDDLAALNDHGSLGMLPPRG
jgi:hypothetical protein